ncbi:TIGR03808 family TAT-translocated repetitive protein [Arvimicrobium flavum]|uniref:TIGR03808 family TAT-translocated repetitive protein n=1 Tax=Arvimicrobium flavum TaxID=3393320 RepID=UPI00237A4123|nr:TIGR03808 family TAT-translocated repetitive protein [Mesorhizobium shangrilense]
MLNRRKLIASLAAVPALGFAVPAIAAPRQPGMQLASMRGSIDAMEFGVRPGAADDQSRAFERMLQSSSDTDTPVFLPAGLYVVSNLTLPPRVRLSGVPGASRIVYRGDGHLFLADRAERVELRGLVIDGGNRWLADHAQGLVDLRNVDRLTIDECEILGSARNGVALERTSGRIERSTISGAADAAIYAVESRGLAIDGNSIRDCANGGILVHRWQAADDGALISGNRIERIAARNGGTGQFGNGINIFRANGVIVSGNSVTDCAFSAIRANSASNLQVQGNTCLRSGETAIYAEFAFEGAVIAGNIVDGAANGISIVNSNEGGRMATCSGNIVRNLSVTGPYPADAPGFGVGISAEADTSVTGNVIEGAPRYGMSIGWGPFMRNVVATGNFVRGSGTGIAVSVVQGVGSAVLTDNIFDDTPNGAIVGHEWARAVTGDLALEGASGHSNLTVDRNRVTS